MGKWLNYILGGLIILVGLNHFIGFIKGFDYAEFVGPLVLIVVGILIMRSKAYVPNLGRYKRIWRLIILGLVVFGIGGILLLQNLGFFAFEIVDWMLTIGIIALGLIVIIFSKKKKEIGQMAVHSSRF